VIIAPATEADAFAIGAVHVLAWHETYRGVVPDAVLASLDPRERGATWLRVSATQGGVFVLREGTRIVGFGAAGPNRDKELAYGGMFNTLYLLSHVQRRGHGRRLMATMARHLLDTGFTDAALWVALANTGACRFYERLGGQIVAHATEQHEGWQMECAAYAWTDLSSLL
jgi:GNAT superfamily N-acetyltransferase